jgi:hypothetical protein
MPQRQISYVKNKMESVMNIQANTEYQDLQNELEMRYGPAFAQGIIDQMIGVISSSPKLAYG